MQAIDDGVDTVIYTDDDGSPGQISLLVEPFVTESAPVVLSPAAMRHGVRKRKATAV